MRLFQFDPHEEDIGDPMRRKNRPPKFLRHPAGGVNGGGIDSARPCAMSKRYATGDTRNGKGHWN